ncbi:hypothetical protein [Haladaptatus halobius]|uniref:hypothetical protein n=1 Tax=Haladaptatus halobius TaxID=2884875 RepID=UPI001D0BBEE9|nr:hypothetical protein [Haladaptatus halobius]
MSTSLRSTKGSILDNIYIRILICYSPLDCPLSTAGCSILDDIDVGVLIDCALGGAECGVLENVDIGILVDRPLSCTLGCAERSILYDIDVNVLIDSTLDCTLGSTLDNRLPLVLR